MGHFLLFATPHGGGFAAFCALLKLIPTYIPGWGGSGFTLTGASTVSAAMFSAVSTAVGAWEKQVLCFRFLRGFWKASY